MALCKSFLRPCGTYLCQRHIVSVFKSQLRRLEILDLNQNRRNFGTSLMKENRWRVSMSKSSKITKNSSKLAKEEAPEAPQSTSALNILIKPFLFTVAFSSASLAGAAIWQYENMRQKTVLLMKKSWNSDRIFKFSKKRYTWRQEFNKMWNQLSEGEKLFAPICLFNVIIYLAWKIKKFHPTMMKYFCSSPFDEAVCWPMILTTFSHSNILHLAANMYALHSFSKSGVEVLGKEQFLGLYLAAGVISSFTSYIYKAVRVQNTISIGASGAIMAMVAYICTKYPDTLLSIILLPSFVFSAGSGIKFIMGFEILGMLRGWKYFDHAAHLGGALCGVGWCYWGNAYIWQNREPLLHWWHGIRTSAK